MRCATTGTLQCDDGYCYQSEVVEPPSTNVTNILTGSMEQLNDLKPTDRQNKTDDFFESSKGAGRKVSKSATVSRDRVRGYLQAGQSVPVEDNQATGDFQREAKGGFYIGDPARRRNEAKLSFTEEFNQFCSKHNLVEVPATSDSQSETPAVVAAKLPPVFEAETPALIQAKTPALTQAETPARTKAEAPASIQAEAPAKIQAEAPAKPQAETPAII
ncbi:skin secretory protein xP2-like [Uranotaenia lowii]|uniref:skin secretory protein xP2-like n=1 Tax=Uranotaenia lowii TaxID=190385 RepID=UPI00247AA98A|nr:skin secretory protein xP2-like [Uranotaenia lowii]